MLGKRLSYQEEENKIHFFFETLVACGKHFDLRKGQSNLVHIFGRTDRAFARHYLADKFLL